MDGGPGKGTGRLAQTEKQSVDSKQSPAHSAPPGTPDPIGSSGHIPFAEEIAPSEGRQGTGSPGADADQQVAEGSGEP